MIYLFSAIYYFIQYLISVLTHGILLGYSNFVPGGGGWFFHVTLTYHCDFAFFFFEHFLLFGTVRSCRFICIFPIYRERPKKPCCFFFPKKPWFLLLENVVRKQDLDMKCALFYSSVIASRALASVFHVSSLPSGCTDSQFQSKWQTEAK